MGRIELITSYRTVDNQTQDFILEHDGDYRKSFRARVLQIRDDWIYYVRPSRRGSILGVARLAEGFIDDLFIKNYRKTN